MAKRTQLLLLLVAILFALVAAWLVTQILAKEKQTHAIKTVAVVQVTQNVGPHQVIQSNDVKVVGIPATAAPLNAVTSTNKLIGQYTAGDWFAGQTVLTDMVTSSASNASFPLQIPQGERAYTLADDSIVGVDHLISAGDHVDVLVTYSSQNGAAKSQPVAKTLLQNVLVLYVDNAPAVQSVATASSNGSSGGSNGASGTSSSSSASSSSSSSKSSPGGVDTITLALKPEDAQKLDYARTFGQVQLVLRNPNDTDTTVVPATNQQP